MKLIDKGIDVDSQFINGSAPTTALEVAIAKKQEKVIEILVLNKAVIYQSTIKLLLQPEHVERFIFWCQNNVFATYNIAKYDKMLKLVLRSKNKDACAAFLEADTRIREEIAGSDLALNSEDKDFNKSVWQKYNEGLDLKKHIEKIDLYTKERKSNLRNYKATLADYSTYFCQSFTLFGKKINFSKVEKIEAAEAVKTFLSNESRTTEDLKKLQEKYKEVLTNGQLAQLIESIPLLRFGR